MVKLIHMNQETLSLYMMNIFHLGFYSHEHWSAHVHRAHNTETSWVPLFWVQNRIDDRIPSCECEEWCSSFSESDYPADALMAVVQKLGGPFHLELAADSIAVKVSEGIMHMQENSITISAKVKHTFPFKTYKYLHVACESHFTLQTSQKAHQKDRAQLVLKPKIKTAEIFVVQ